MRKLEPSPRMSVCCGTAMLRNLKHDAYLQLFVHILGVKRLAEIDDEVRVEESATIAISWQPLTPIRCTVSVTVAATGLSQKTLKNERKTGK
jgi:hypothetical protein